MLKYMTYMNAFTNYPLFRKWLSHKKECPAYRNPLASIKKLNTLNMAAINKTLINSGLSYAVNHLKGVFHRLNSCSGVAVAPMFEVLGLSNCLIYSCLNCF